jgi:hypothetical protein
VHASANTDFSVDKVESRADAQKVVLNQSWRGFWNRYQNRTELI